MVLTRALICLVLASPPAALFAGEVSVPELPALREVMENISIKEFEQVRVDMSIRSVFSGDRYDISDRDSRIEMSVDREHGGTGFRFGGHVGNRYLSGTVEVSADKSSYRIWGGGLSVDMRKWGASDYQISGFMDEETGSQHMDVTLRQRGLPGSFHVWDHGVSLNISKFGGSIDVSGDIRPKDFGKRSLAVLGVFVAVLEAELDKPAPAAR